MLTTPDLTNTSATPAAEIAGVVLW